MSNLGIPKIDARTEKDILNYIEKTAPYYTPKWRFNPADPDVGTALCLIYSKMFAETIDRFNQSPYNNMLALFNRLGAGLLPAVPSEGYVYFSLSASAAEEGSYVKKGLKLFADLDGIPDPCVFETEEDVFVTPASVEHIFAVSGMQDKIIHAFSAEDNPEGAKQAALFDYAAKSLNSHVMYVNNDDIFEIGGGATVCVRLDPRTAGAEDYKKLADPSLAAWFYHGTEGYEPFSGVKAADDCLMLLKGESTNPFFKTEEKDREGHYIKCVVKNIWAFTNFPVSNMRISSACGELAPDVMYANDYLLDKYGFFPFGENYAIYDDFYIACNEAFVKKGAQVTVSFALDFRKIAIERAEAVLDIDWKPVMKKDAFRIEEDYEISIAESVWEYFNGSGWIKLNTASDMETVFCANGGELKKKLIKLVFTCPHDMSGVLVNAFEGRYIRARILKVNNAYKTRGYVITPWIEGVSVNYSYTDGGLAPNLVITENNTETDIYEKRRLHAPGCSFIPFRPMKEQGPALYFGFEIPPVGSPVRVLFSMLRHAGGKMPELYWEYYSPVGFKKLNVMDLTNGFKNTGLLTFTGESDMKRAVFFGQDLYWLRATDINAAYDNPNLGKRPVISDMHMNAVPVANKDTVPEEFFMIDSQEKNKIFKLIYGKVTDIEVWVNERNTVGESERKSLEKAGSARVVYNENGSVSDVWVKWTEVSDFLQSDPDCRHYIVDRNEGRVLFSDGANGKIPASLENESIRIAYRTGGGKHANVAPGAISRMNESIGFINLVCNPYKTTGGCDMENTESSLSRNANRLKHAGRAVCAGDYENMAREVAGGNILKVKCFPNVNKYGRREAGTVTLVIMLADSLFEKTKEEVTKYIKENSSFSLANFYVIEPRFLKISVRITAETNDFNNVFDIRNEMNERLKSFLDPLSGNFDGNGWEIGSVPSADQIINGLRNIKGVTVMRDVFMRIERETSRGFEELDYRELKKNLFALPVSGGHDINITVS